MKKWKLKLRVDDLEGAIAVNEFTIKNLAKERDDHAELICKLQQSLDIARSNSDAFVKVGENRMPSRVRIQQLEQELSDACQKLKEHGGRADLYINELQAAATTLDKNRVEVNRLESDLKQCQQNLRSTSDTAASHLKKLNALIAQFEKLLRRLGASESSIIEIRQGLGTVERLVDNYEKNQRGRDWLKPSELHGAGQVVMVPVKRYRELIANEVPQTVHKIEVIK